MNVRALLATLFFFAAVLPTVARGQQTAQELFQSGLYQEEVQGDLQSAIEIYRTLVRDHAGNRDVAARAQLHIGFCFELLGRTEAERAYQAVLDEYADQAEVAGEARVRLEALRAAMEIVASEGLVQRRLLEDDGCRIVFMKPSPDGKRIAYSDICAAMAVHVLDLASGETEQITTENMHFGVAWSPDGGRIATGMVGVDGAQLEIIDLESGDIQVVDPVNGVGLLPDDWSSDGDHISGMVGNGPRRSTVMVSLSSGERTPLGSGITMQMLRATFSPDGRFVAFADPADGNQEIFIQNVATGDRRRVTRDPKDNWGAVWSPDGGTLVYNNPDGTWALGIVDGQASGDPRLVSSDRNGSAQTSNAWTSNGYYYAIETSVTNGTRVPVDPESAQPLGPPEPMPESLPGLGWNTKLVWSPDMTTVASTGGEKPNQISFSRGQSVTSIHIGEDVVVWGMWWSPDGSELLYTARNDTRPDPGRTVYALDPTDGAIRELFPPVDAQIHNLHVSPDGEQMVFLRTLQPRPEDQLTNVDELMVSELGNPSNGRVLATSSGAEGYLATQINEPAFSPDGSQIMFVRYHHVGEGYGSDDLESSLWIVPADGSSPPRQLDRSRNVGYGMWDPSGRWYVYGDPAGLQNPESSTPLTVISIETGEKHTIVARETLESMGITQMRVTAWSPDGRWIGAIETKGGYELWVVPDLLGEASGGSR